MNTLSIRTARPLLLTMVVGVLIPMSRDAEAVSTLSLSLSSSPTDLSGLAIGEPVTVDVSLSGLASGDRLDSLMATIVYDATLLGTPMITPGAILPNPLDDPLDLVTTAAPGVADVAFLTFGLDAADHISTNGVFFSFSLTVAAPGSGSVAFEFVNATGFNELDPDAPLAVESIPGPDLDFSTVPEPSSAVLTAMSLAALLARRHSRR